MTRRAAISASTIAAAAKSAREQSVTVEIVHNGTVIKIEPSTGVVTRREVRL